MTPLEYNLQAVENTEGTIVTNPQTGEKLSIEEQKEALKIQMETLLWPAANFKLL